MSAPHHAAPTIVRGRRLPFPLAAACIALAVAVGGCDPADADDPLAPGSAPELAAQQSWADRSGDIFWNGCFGEFIGFGDGSKAHRVSHTRTDGNGGFHITIHGNGADYSGPGLTCNVDATGAPIPATCQPTGTYYQGNATFTYSVNARPPFPVSYSYPRTTVVNQRGSAAGFLLHVTDHFTVDANGTVTSDVQDWRVECR